MYILVVIVVTLILPIGSILSEYVSGTAMPLTMLIGKWFVFWGVGVRLLTAGMSQILRPQMTASGILGIEGIGADRIVRELGFANLALGLAGVLTTFWPAWIPPAGLAGSVFLGLAGVQHVRTTGRTAKESVAMATDLIVACLIAVYFVAWLASPS